MSFQNIYGHARQVDILQKSMAQGRVGHSYLLSGPAGVGKKAVALAFGAALNCENRIEHSDACGQCPACRKMFHGHHPDLHVITPRGQFIRIDAIRDIQEQMTFKPLEGGQRIVIIDEADRMNEQAANALLKTLEEPSPANRIILITSRPHWLYATILSRCRQLRFQPLSTDTLVGFLVKERGMDDARARILAGLAGGSVATALALDDDEVMAYRLELAETLQAVASDRPETLLALAAFIGQDKKDIRVALDMLRTLFRDALVYRETGDALRVMNADCLAVLQQLALRVTGAKMAFNIARVDQALAAIEMNVNKTLTLEAMAFKLHL